MKKLSYTRRDFMKTVGLGTAALALPGCAGVSRRLAVGRPRELPNILFCISDDQSWLHAGAYGDKVVKTPNFDRIANEGVLFNHAYCAAPSCTPSRGGILTGQHIWRLEQGGNLWSTLPAKFPVYPDLHYEAPTKEYMMRHRHDPEVRRLFGLAFGKRPAHELYDLRNDPHQMNNVAEEPEYREARLKVAAQLQAYLERTGDPRATGEEPMWDSYPYYGNKEPHPREGAPIMEP